MRLQVPSPHESLGVGNLNDPRARRPFRAVKQDAFLVDVEEYVLNKIICFSFISQNSLADIPDKASMPPKK